MHSSRREQEEEAGVGVPERSSGGSDSEASMSSAPPGDSWSAMPGVPQQHAGI